MTHSEDQKGSLALEPIRPPANRFVRYARKLYHPLGFRKGYNFPLWVITIGALLGFAVARFACLNIDGIYLKKTAPGEQIYFRSGFRRTGVILHLSTVLPAITLVGFQFVPAIRYKAILLHRINGYTCIILLLLANAGGFMMARSSFGGAPDIQIYIGLVGAIVTTALILAYINIKTLQIDQHRAWMMRAWVWAASIITERLLFTAARHVVRMYFTYYVAIKCEEITYMYEYFANLTGPNNPASQLYPQCVDPSAYVAVSTRDTHGNHGYENFAALCRVLFAGTGWIALAIHVSLLELYLALTPAESARLRKISHERQVKAGYRFADKGSLTASRLGDAPPGWNAPLTDNPNPTGDDSSDTNVTRITELPKIHNPSEKQYPNQLRSEAV